MSDGKRFYVYIMTNRPRSHVLYTGMTGKPPPPSLGAQEQTLGGVHLPLQPDTARLLGVLFLPDAAISREKEIKGWRRSKKIRLIESMNPHWHDLAERWGDVYKPSLVGDPREIPRPAGESAGLRDDAPD